MEITYTNNISAEENNMLREAVGWEVYRIDKLSVALERSDYIIAAYSDSKTVGMARVICDGLQALIIDVIVLPEYQGYGIGKTIMTLVMEYLESISHEGGVFVTLNAATGKETFYKKFGFIERPNDSRGAGMYQMIGK